MASALEQYDPQIYELIRQEKARQSGALRLIPSENYVSRAVMTATGSCLTNKYSEGYPGRRYYEGQQVTDLVETLAIERAKQIFKADHANVQPYSGSVANLAAYNALIKPGDTIMGLGLSSGGHLTHGSAGSITSRFFKSVSYMVNPETGRIDYNEVEAPALVISHFFQDILCLSGNKGAVPNGISLGIQLGILDRFIRLLDADNCS